MHATPVDRAVGTAVAVLTVLLVLAAVPAHAQEAPTSLTLEEAIGLARHNNPDFLMRRNDDTEAEWAVREAYAAFLPSASVGAGMQYQAAGQPRFGAFTGEDVGLGQTPPYLFSNYRVGLSYRLDAGMFARVDQERAQRRATRARTRAAANQLAADVTTRYLAVLRARDGVKLARAELERADKTLELARARAAVGATIGLDAKQAALERGRAEVALLQAENQLHAAKLRLFETLGVEPMRDVRLTTEFRVFEPSWSSERLVSMAVERQPALRTLRAAEAAAEAGVDVAQSAYLPSLSITAGWSGFTRAVGNEGYLLDQASTRAAAALDACRQENMLRSRLSPPLPPQNCSALPSADAIGARLLEQNDVFPLDFRQQPFSVGLQLSLPIFQGLTRQHRVATAEVAAADARQRLRARTLQLRTQVVSALGTLETAWRTVVLERRNRELAAEQLRLARERYRVGAARFLALQEAETLKARADRAYLDAIYTFHEALARLEAAVGRDLRGAAESHSEDDS